MFWVSITGILVGVAWIGVILWKTPCIMTGCEFEKPDPISGEDSTPILESVQNCQRVLHELESQKQQLDHRLQILDEMISRSDREIVRFEEQLWRMEEIQSTSFSQTELEMLRLLRAGGYASDEIARLALRSPDEINRAA